MKRVVPLTGWMEIEPESPQDHQFQELLSRYAAFLRKTISRMLPSGEGLSFEDVEQEARLELWRALRSEREIAHPGSYVHKVAVTATLRAIRRARARREEQLEEGDPPPGGEIPQSDPETLARRRELMEKLDSALSRLAENRRTAVRLHLQGLSAAEIGELLGWSEPKARNLVHRGLMDLRRELRVEGIEGA